MPGVFLSGPVRFESLPCGGLMRLLSPVTYRDSAGLVWEAPALAVTDGASIPRALWTIAGNPFGGPELPAAVVHDVYCQGRVRPWEATHRMFAEACLAAGCTPFRARLLGLAVLRFGPRWSMPGEPGLYVATTEPTPEDVEMLVAEVRGECGRWAGEMMA